MITIKAIIDKHHKIDIDEENIETKYKKMRTWLRSVGFRFIGRGCYKDVYARKGFNYVIKIGDTFWHEEPDEEVCLLPVFINDWLEIQQKVSLRNRDEAYKIIHKYLDDKGSEIADAHCDNVGWLGKKPVLFDW